MTRQDKFELCYEAFTGESRETLRANRLSNGSYQFPKYSTAWSWFQQGYNKGFDHCENGLLAEQVRQGRQTENVVLDA